MTRFSALISQIVDRLHHTRAQAFLPTSSSSHSTTDCPAAQSSPHQPNSYQRLYAATPMDWGHQGGYSPPACQTPSAAPRQSTSHTHSASPQNLRRSFRLFESTPD